MNGNNNLLTYQLIPGIRKNSKLLLIPNENQVYKYKYKSGFTTYYTCYQKTCRVNVAVDLEDLCRKTTAINHNHGSEEEFINRLKLINSNKDNCDTVSLKRNNVREIFNDTCKNKSSCTSIQYGKMRRHSQRIKNNFMPKSPSSFKDILKMFQENKIMKEFGMSRYEKDEKFYYNTIIEENFAYSIFMSPTICSIINSWENNEPRNYLMNETFSITPTGSIFKQIIIIHIAHSEYVSIYYIAFSFFAPYQTSAKGRDSRRCRYGAPRALLQ